MQDLANPAFHAELWKRAQTMCARAIAAIGEPAALSVRGNLPRQARHEIAGWLALLESIVRKLLFAAAAAIIMDEGRRANRDKAPRVETIRIAGLHTRVAPPALSGVSGAKAEAVRVKPQPSLRIANSDPETWPARFAFAPPRDPHLVPESRAPRIRALWGPTPPPPPPPAPRAERRVTEPAMRFALRLEALKRVLADPIPHARRLARVFQRLIRRYPQAVHRYAIAPARPYAADEGDPRLIIDVMAIAMTAAHVFANTS